MMLLPVFVIHWNAPDWCAETVDSILRSQGVDVALTVIDNASDSRPVLPESVLLKRLDTNIGYAGAANRAIDEAAAANAELLVIASHDVTVAPGCLAAMVRLAVSSPCVGIVGPDFGTDTVADGWLSGSLMLVRASCAADVGSFDTLFGSYCEEVDYCHRATARGWQLAIAQGAIATTHGTRHAERARRLMDANFTLLAAKEGDWRRVIDRLGGMLRRSVTDPRGGWHWSFLLSLRQLGRYFARAASQRL